MFKTFKDYPKQKDHIIKGFSVKKNFRITFVDNTTSLQTSVDKFKLEDDRQINLLGNCFSTSLMISSLLKGEERIKAIISFEDKNKIINDFYAESMANGEIRGFALKNKSENQKYDPFFKIGKQQNLHTKFLFYLFNIRLLKSLNKINLQRLGGQLVIIRDQDSIQCYFYERMFYMDTHKKRLVCLGQIILKIKIGLIFQENKYKNFIKIPIKYQIYAIFTLYLKNHSKFYFKTQIIKRINILNIFRVQRSFGYMLQKMPDAKESYLEQIHEDLMNSSLYQSIKNDISIKKILFLMKTKGLNFSQVKDLLEKQFNIDDIQLTRYPVDFYCRCSKDNYLKLLANIGTETLEDMKQKNQKTLNCIYCNTNYTIEDADFEKLIKESKDIQNTHVNQKNEQTIIQKS